ncbi:MAG: phosphoribosylanthranilate isomerase [Burkholderiales bacterium]|nr:phosphoribosylanthranilate isomerase [Burkholderiales bacterium]
MRTRIKICGITSPGDAQSAAQHGADAIGLVFYAPSPRCVTAEQAREIARATPPFVSRVALFVNPSADEVRAVLATCRVDLLQFHGEEGPVFCGQFGVPYLKTLRVRKGADLLESLSPYGDAAGWLLDTYRPDFYGGTGEAFDWDVIPARLARPVVLSGGLTAANVGEAIRRTRPWAVDVSSGVEARKGVKDADKIAAFIQGVRNADV